MRRGLALIVLAILAGCSKPAGSPTGAGAKSEAVGAAAPAKPGATAPTAATGQIAYAHDLTLDVPGRRLGALVRGHEEACRSAGPAVCQLLSSQIEARPGAAVAGEIRLRADPAWLGRFRARLEADATAAGGFTANRATTADDLTATIVDTEARERASLTLRDRLQALLASHRGAMADLLEIERELARVEGELDDARSQAAALRARIAFATLTVHYQATETGRGEGGWGAVGRAFAGGGDTFAASLATLVTLVLALLPWLALAAGVVAIVAWLRGRARRARPRSD